MLHVDYPQFHLVQKTSEVASEVNVRWPPQCLIHLHRIKVVWLQLLPFLSVYIVPYLSGLLFLLLPRFIPQCPLPIYFLLPLTFHSSHTCLLSEDRPLHGSPSHVQCDQYKGQGPCTRTPPLTKREGLKAGETVWWVPVHCHTCLWVCVHTDVLGFWHHMCILLHVSAGERTLHSETCK